MDLGSTFNVTCSIIKKKATPGIEKLISKKVSLNKLHAFAILLTVVLEPMPSASTPVSSTSASVTSASAGYFCSTDPNDPYLKSKEYWNFPCGGATYAKSAETINTPIGEFVKDLLQNTLMQIDLHSEMYTLFKDKYFTRLDESVRAGMRNNHPTEMTLNTTALKVLSNDQIKKISENDNEFINQTHKIYHHFKRLAVGLEEIKEHLLKCENEPNLSRLAVNIYNETIHMLCAMEPIIEDKFQLDLTRNLSRKILSPSLRHSSSHTNLTTGFLAILHDYGEAINYSQKLWDEYNKINNPQTDV